MIPLQLHVSEQAIREFCERWHVRELALFGSAARNELRPESDVDVMVEFAPEAQWSLFDFARMKLELEELFLRPVDLVEKGTVRNPFRRRRIERDFTIVYAA